MKERTYYIEELIRINKMGGLRTGAEQAIIEQNNVIALLLLDIRDLLLQKEKEQKT